MADIIALTGAGISRDSGIPTFEELGFDFRRKLHVEYDWRNDSEVIRVLDIINNAMPNEAHYILARLNIPIITTNIDDLHRQAGSTNIIELHGSIINDNVVLYGMNINQDLLSAAQLLICKCQTILVIGSSGYTNTQYELVEMAACLNKNIIYMNRNATEELNAFFNLGGEL